MANLTDFHHLTLDVAERKIVKRLRFRDHGHKTNILNSSAVLSGMSHGESPTTLRQLLCFFFPFVKL